MSFLFRDKTAMPEPADALPGRDARPFDRARHAFRARHAARAALPRGRRDGDLRHGLLLGSRARLLAGARRLHHRRGLRRRLHAEPHLRGGLQRAHRPQRGRPRGLPPRGDLLRRAAAPVLGGPRPDAGHAPGQRRGHPVPLRDLRDLGRPARRRRGLARALRRSGCATRATATSPPRSSTRRSSSTPRTTTSSTSPRTRAATAGSAAPASAAQ